jgi:formate hydrogenlyase subunit 3/multisubunit Na+/H+ antiporter MnhD subunit
MSSEHQTLLTFILLPFFAAAFAFVFPNISSRLVTLCSAFLTFFAHKLFETQSLCSVVGGYPRILGIELCYEESLFLPLLSTQLIFLLFSFSKLPSQASAVSAIMLGAFNGVLLTNDAFNLFVWFEVILICSFVLPVFFKECNFKNLLKFMVLNMLGSFFLLSGVALVYKQTGYLNLTKIKKVVGQLGPSALDQAYIFFIISFGLKAGLIPFHNWLGCSYHGFDKRLLPLFYALLSKIGVVAMVRVLGVIDSPTPLVLYIISILSFVSILVGAALAYFENNLARSLAFLTISKSGLLFTLGLSFSATLLYMYLAFDMLGTFLFSALLLKNFEITKVDKPALTFDIAELFTFYFLAFTLLGFPVSAIFLITFIGFSQTEFTWLLIVTLMAFKLGFLAFVFKLIAKFSSQPGIRKASCLEFAVAVFLCCYLSFCVLRRMSF